MYPCLARERRRGGGDEGKGGRKRTEWRGPRETLNNLLMLSAGPLLNPPPQAGGGGGVIQTIPSPTRRLHGSTSGGLEITFFAVTFCNILYHFESGAGGLCDWTADGPPPELVRLGQCRRRGGVRGRGGCRRGRRFPCRGTGMTEAPAEGVDSRVGAGMTEAPPRAWIPVSGHGNDGGFPSLRWRRCR